MKTTKPDVAGDDNVRPNQNDNDAYLTQEELSARWKITSRTLEQHRWRGIGCPYVKIGRLVRYRLSDIIAYELVRTVSFNNEGSA